MSHIVGRARWAAGRACVALGAWREGTLSSRDIARLALRVARLQRFAAAGAAVETPHRAELPAAPKPPASPEPEMPTVQREVMDRLAALNTSLSAELARAQQTIAHLRRVEEAYRQVATVVDQLATAQRGVQAFVTSWQSILFETAETTNPGRSAATLVLGDRPVEDSLATLVNLSEAAHGARPFQYVVPFLAGQRPFPLSWPAEMENLQIVDVGSQELASEADMHAPLRGIAPVEITGFDPFTQPAADAPGVLVEVKRPDGTTIRTYPLIVADGGPVTLHVNRYDATSSLLLANLPLARQFGLLGLALETVETRQFTSTRLDDVLPPGRVDLLKIDVQGMTHTVLANARRVLADTLICHVETEFAPIYEGEHLFADIDALLRDAGFCFVDFFSLGRQRYAAFESSPARAFHRGRTLWADCIYMRGLDAPDSLDNDALFRAALIVHACYNKQDLAAELLGRLDARQGSRLLSAYLTPTDRAGAE